MYAAILFIGATNAATIQPAIAIERTGFYHEKSDGMYSAIPYAISQIVVICMSFFLSLRNLFSGSSPQDWYVAKTDMVETVLLGNTSGLDVVQYHNISSIVQIADVRDMSLKTLLEDG